MFRAEVWVVEFDRSLENESVDDCQSLGCLFSLVVEVENQNPANANLEDVYDKSSPRLVTEDAKEFPHFALVVELGRVSVELDYHNELEDEKRKCHDYHQAAKELLKLDVCLVYA